MKFLLLIIMTVLILFAAFAQEPSQKKIAVDDIKVLKISTKDERAVIKTSEKKLQVIKVGDQIGENTKVIEITKARVVIEELTDKGTETIIIRVENGKQKVERIRKIEEKQPQHSAPQSTSGEDPEKSTDE